MIEKTVVITGAGSGLGASLARKYSASGNHVCLLGRKKDKLVRIASKLEGNHSIYEVDVTSTTSIKNVMAKIREERGSIDCLINNAGVGVFKHLEELHEEEINQMIDTNLKGTIYCTREVLPGMRERNKGSIVNIVSASGKEAKATESVYSASKFGVRGFSDAIALELKNSNIQIFSVFMGNMKTDLWGDDHPEAQLNNYMDPEDVAEIIIENLKPRRHLCVTDITILNHI
ncbi:SDR family oxidoreductase [Psychrobacillus soli]|uniref:SDR family NAD(P)-dependent oxidoreductase n=1 Tax=Psychrobacillus soli TaxID=1543965 RepID=A0A544TKF8_9BACI|nr:SDR family NAD(P)-dependent oxidoreductase [Psychrobacillus soli]TQR17931.1 SDR family NAD(P)-dependent oxidoreductase [Psychrobacillus soli]